MFNKNDAVPKVLNVVFDNAGTIPKTTLLLLIYAEHLSLESLEDTATQKQKQIKVKSQQQRYGQRITKHQH